MSAVGVAASSPAAPRSYRDFVSPGHPLIAGLFPGPAPRRSEGGSRALEAVLAAARRRLRYDPTPGRHEFAELVPRLAAAVNGPVTLNCIDAACALASSLRRAGFSADEVHVALGGRASTIVAGGGEQFHAWLAVHVEEGLRWVDPADLQAVPADADDVLARHRLYAVFNDRDLFVHDAAKRRALAGGRRRGGLRVYLFGRAEPALAEAIGDARFQRALKAMAATQVCAGGDLDAEAAAGVAGWVDAGLLARDGDRLRPGRKLVLVSRRAEEELFSLSGADLDRYLGIVAAVVPRLTAAWDLTSAAARWPWAEVAHAVVGGLLLDLSVGREFEILRRVRSARGESVVWAFEGVSAEQGIGVVWAEGPRETGGSVSSGTST